MVRVSSIFVVVVSNTLEVDIPTYFNRVIIHYIVYCILNILLFMFLEWDSTCTQVLFDVEDKLLRFLKWSKFLELLKSIRLRQESV